MKIIDLSVKAALITYRRAASNYIFLYLCEKYVCPTKMLDFLNISLIDIIDIIIVGLLIYQIFKLIKGTAAMGIFLGILTILVLWIIVDALNMKLTSAIISQILGVGFIAIIVLFQQEIRRFLLHLGSRYMRQSGNKKGFFKLLFGKGSKVELTSKSVNEIVEACIRMSDDKTGALIIIPHISDLSSIIETGDIIDAKISHRLIMNIFFKNSPLHDGAMIISSDRIVAARCTLPISENPNLPSHFGMRHKAACGVTEETDADAIVVSEETGNVSFVTNGEATKINNSGELRAAIENSLKLQKTQDKTSEEGK